jgi:phosphate transport system substrate-binding protein
VRERITGAVLPVCRVSGTGLGVGYRELAENRRAAGKGGDRHRCPALARKQHARLLRPPRLAKAFLEKQGATEVIVNDESRAKERIWVQARIRGVDTSIEIYAPGTKVGFESLSQGGCDVVLASRPITTDEVTKLEPIGDLTTPTSETVVAMDGIAIIVHPANPVMQLTVKQLEQVFSGKVTNWTQLAGKAGPIHVLARDQKSGTHDGFVALVMQGKQPKAEKTFEDSEALVAAVAKDEGAIGFVGLPYVKQTKPLAIQDGATRAVLPTPFAIATEDYPLARRLFFYTPPTAKTPLSKELVEFALSDEGQTIVGESGFVPLSLRVETAPVPPNAPPRYAKLAQGATRLSVSFRFKNGSASLDAKSRRDLDRLIKHVASPMNRGRHLALAGFADNQGQRRGERARRQAGHGRGRGVARQGRHSARRGRDVRQRSPGRLERFIRRPRQEPPRRSLAPLTPGR